MVIRKEEKMKKLYVLTTAVLVGLCSPAFAVITSLTVDSGTVSKSTGQVTLSGTITCTVGDEVDLQAEALQLKSSQKFADAFGNFDGLLTCSGETQSWTIVLDDSTFGSQGFQAGPAGGNADAFDETDQSDTSVTSTVHLRWVP
jgi:hypothetical protein